MKFDDDLKIINHAKAHHGIPRFVTPHLEKLWADPRILAQTSPVGRYEPTKSMKQRAQPTHSKSALHPPNFGQSKPVGCKQGKASKLRLSFSQNHDSAA